MVSPGQLSESMHPAAYSQESSISNNLPGAGARSQDLATSSQHNQEDQTAQSNNRAQPAAEIRKHQELVTTSKAATNRLPASNHPAARRPA